MSLAQRAKNPPEIKGPGVPCSVGRLLSELDSAEAKALQAILDAPWRVWPHAEVERALEDEGHRVGTGQIGKHRRGTCRCPKKP